MTSSLETLSDIKSEEQQMIAVESNPSSIGLIKNPALNVLKRVIELDVEELAYIQDLPEEIQLLIIKKDPSMILKIYDPLPITYHLALELKPQLLEDLYENDINITPEMIRIVFTGSLNLLNKSWIMEQIINRDYSEKTNLSIESLLVLESFADASQKKRIYEHKNYISPAHLILDTLKKNKD